MCGCPEVSCSTTSMNAKPRSKDRAILLVGGFDESELTMTVSIPLYNIYSKTHSCNIHIQFATYSGMMMPNAAPSNRPEPRVERYAMRDPGVVKFESFCSSSAREMGGRSLETEETKGSIPIPNDAAPSSAAMIRTVRMPAMTFKRFKSVFYKNFDMTQEWPRKS